MQTAPPLSHERVALERATPLRGGRQLGGLLGHLVAGDEGQEGLGVRRRRVLALAGVVVGVGGVGGHGRLAELGADEEGQDVALDAGKTEKW